MGAEILRIDEAVDVIASESGTLRFLLPSSEFTLRDPTGLVQRVSSQFRTGARPDDILSLCHDAEERQATVQLIDLFRTRRVLRIAEAAEDTPRDPLASWLRHYAGAGAKKFKTIEMRGDGRLADLLRDRLGDAGVSVEPSPNACLIAVSDTPDLPWLRRQNAEACAAGRTFLPAWLERSSVFWGPAIVPGGTGCLECLQHRRQAARKRAEAVVDTECPHLAVSSTVAALGSSLIAAEIMRWAFDAHIDTELGMAWSFDLVSMALSGAKVLRLPRCPVCAPTRSAA